MTANLAVVFEIVGEVRRRHAAGPDILVNGVAVGKGGLGTVEMVLSWRTKGRTFPGFGEGKASGVPARARSKPY